MINYRAESAYYTVLRRVAPVLRHEFAGLMQPVRLLVTVLERRLAKPDFNLTLAQENIASIGELTKQAVAGYNNVIAWLSMDDNTQIDLSTGIDELIKILAFELESAMLSVLNEIPNDKLSVSQGFLRTLLAGILLAFCDERKDHRHLQIVFVQNIHDQEPQSLDAGILFLSSKSEAKVDSCIKENLTEPDRRVDWDDVGALAQLSSVTISRGSGWLRINIAHFEQSS